MSTITCHLRSMAFAGSSITDNSGVSSTLVSSHTDQMITDGSRSDIVLHLTAGTSSRTFTLAEIREMSPVHPQDGRRTNFDQPVPLSPPLAELNEMVQYKGFSAPICS